MLAPSPSFRPPQEHRDQEDQKRQAAIEWQRADDANKELSKAADDASAAKGSLEKAPTKLTKKISLVEAKKLLPPKTGFTIWHEWQTDRIRGSFLGKERKETCSLPIGAGAVETATIGVLRMLWKVFTDAGGDPSPWEELR